MTEPMTKGQFKEEWMRDQEILATVQFSLVEIQQNHRRLYQVVVGEPPPAYEPRLIWDTEPDRAA